MSLLEVQVADLREDMTVVQAGVVDLDENVDFLFDEQVIQDERLLNLEETSFEIVGELEGRFCFVKMDVGCTIKRTLSMNITDVCLYLKTIYHEVTQLLSRNCES